MVKLVIIITVLLTGGIAVLTLMQRHHQAVAHQMIPPSTRPSTVTLGTER
jgi:hypothetical protein